VLSIVGAVEVDAFRVATRSSVITTNNEVGSAMILADDGMPDSFAGTCHAHSEGKQTENSHSVGVTRKESLVDTDTSEVINVTRLSETDHGVDQNIGLSGASSANSKFPVCSVHRISCLESNDLGPAKFVKVQTKFCGGIS
jgi:hypothetical protein